MLRKAGIRNVVLGVSLLTMSAVANADPLVLTQSQMEQVTAGGLIDDINITAQVAVPFSFAIAICGVCGDNATIVANAVSVASNNNWIFSLD